MAVTGEPRLRVEGLSARRRARPAGAARRLAGGPRRRDRGRRRRLGQRPDGARRGARGHARPDRRVASLVEGVELAGADPVGGHGGGRGPHPGGPPRQPRAGPAGGAQPGPGAHRRLHGRRPAGPARASTSTRATLIERYRHQGPPGRPRRRRCRAATSRRCCWRASCRATRGSSSSRSPRAASTSGATEYVRGELLARRAARARPSCSSPRTSTSCSRCPTGVVVLYEGRVIGRMCLGGGRPRTARPADGRAGRRPHERRCTPGRDASAPEADLMLEARRAAETRLGRGGHRRGRCSSPCWPSPAPPSSSPAPTPSTATSPTSWRRSPASSRCWRSSTWPRRSCSPAAAVAIAFRAGYWNIGVEGQLLMGAVAAAGIGQVVRRLAAPSWCCR